MGRGFANMFACVGCVFGAISFVLWWKKRILNFLTSKCKLEKIENEFGFWETFECIKLREKPWCGIIKPMLFI